MKGVHAVVTREDVPLNVYGHLSALGIPGDEPLLAEDEVRYLGQPIAVVAAEDEELAQAAVDAIVLELRRAEPLFDVRKAFDPDAPQIHEWGNWYPHFEAEMDRRQIRKGDIDAAFDARRPDRPGRLPAGRDRARAARDAGLPGRARAERAAHDLLLHAGALLLDGRRRGAPAAAAEQVQVRRRHGRRRLRRQGRHGHRDDVRAARAQVRASRCSGAGRARRSSSARRPARRGTWRSPTRSRRTAGSSAARC